jgi:hypothetical protein
MTYQELINKLNNREPFSFSRFGDGEFACMLGKSGANCDGHEYFPDLGERLNQAWNDPKGIIGTQRYGQAMYPQFTHTGIDADILHKASINGELDLLVNTLDARRYDIIMIGPSRLRGAILCSTFIEVPLKNAWEKYDYTLERLRFHVQKWDIILYCCGMMAEVLIHDMYSDDITQIDCGSVFDPYVGVNSRMYHKKLKL